MTAHHLPSLLMASAATAVWAGPPNILILLTDDQRWDTVRVNNPGLAMETPHLDRLARDGINFQNAFVTTPICAVSRAGILTGRYARNAQVHCFLIPPPDEVWQSSYPARMKEAGYFLGQLGKYGVGATPAQRTERLRRMFAQWERENPDTYTPMLYSHRPQAHPPEIDWPRFRTAHPAAYARIKAEIERRGVTWEDAFTDWDLRWEIGLAARFFY